MTFLHFLFTDPDVSRVTYTVIVVLIGLVALHRGSNIPEDGHAAYRRLRFAARLAADARRTAAAEPPRGVAEACGDASEPDAVAVRVR